MKKKRIVRFFVNLAWLLSVMLIGVQASAAGVTYYGRLLTAAGDPVIASSVHFKIQIRSPGNESCILYEEQQIKDLAATKGVFAVTIGDGSASVANVEPFPMDRVFQNRGTFSFAAGKCLVGTTYSPNPADGRVIAVEFNDGSFSGWEQIPSLTLNFVPMAIESISVGGFNANNLFRVVDGSGAPATVSPLTQNQHDILLDLVNGSSGTYLKGTSPLNGANLADGSVTEAKLAGGIPGAKITGNIPGNAAGFSGSLSGDVSGTQAATTVTKIQGRAVDTSAPANGQALVWDAADSRWEPGTVSGGGGVDWSSITGKPTTFASDWATTANKPASFPSDWSTLANIPLTFAPSGHSHPVDQIASATGAYFTYKPDNSACADGGVLKWNDGAGRWVCGVDAGSAGTIASLSVTAPVVKTGTASDPILSVTDASTSTKGVVRLATGSDTSAGLAVQADDARLSDSRAPNGAAGGELDGNYPNPTVVASTVASNNSIVRRDGTGGITGAGANFSSLALTNGASTITLSAPTAFTTYATKLPGTAGTSGQILTSNGTDMIWSTPSFMPSVAPGGAGQVLTSNGGAWISAAPAVNVAGVSSAAGTYLTYKPDNNACADGGVLKWNGSGGRWECGVDAGSAGTIASVSVTAPILKTGTTSDPVLSVADASTSAKGVVQLGTSASTSAGLAVQANDTRLTDARVPTGAAGGELDGNYPNPTVVASTTATNNSLVRRDGSGVIAGAAGDFGSVILNNGGGSTITVQTPSAFSSYVLKLPSDAGSAGQVLTSNGTDMVWSGASSLTAGNVSGTVAVANGGTGAASASGARTNLGITATGDSLVTAGSAADARIAIGAVSDADSRLGPTPGAGNAGYYLRINGGGTAVQARSPANALADIGAMAAVVPGSNGQVMTVSGGSWTSAALPVATTGAQGVMRVGTGLSVSSGTVSADFGTGSGKVAQGNDSRFPSSTCASGNINRWNGTAWVCEAATATDSTKVAKTGDTMTGALALPAGGLAVGTNQLVVSSGNVGIGTTSPAYPFHVVTNGNVPIGIQNSNNTGYSSIRFIDSAGTLKSSIGYANAGASQFAQQAYLSTYDSTPIVLITNFSERVRIDGSGNVGIGTASPSEKLEVNGKVKATELCIAADCRNAWPSGGGGETNTMSNLTGTAGAVGVFKQKTGVNFEMKKINVASTAVTITDDTGNNEVDIGVNAELGALAALSTNGFVKRTGAGTYTTPSSLSLTTDISGVLPVANGGTGFSSIATQRVVVSTATDTLGSVGGSTGQILQQTVTGPQFTTATYPSSTTINRLLYSSANNIVNELATQNSSVLTTSAGGVPQWSLLTNDTFTQYALLAGRAGNQVLNGGTAASGTLTLDSTAHATKGNVVINPTGGNVGIGTTAPGAKLEVNGNVKATAFCLGADCKTSWPSGGGTPAGTADGDLQIKSGTGFGSAPYLNFDASNAVLTVAGETYESGYPTGPYKGTLNLGRVKMQTNHGTVSTSFKMSDLVSGNAFLTYSADTNGFYSNLSLQTDNVTRMTIKETGRIGIGTVSPSEKLHVVGNLRVQGSTDCTLGNGSGGTNCSSDIRLKTNVQEIQNPLGKILSLRGVEFDWNDKSQSPGDHAIGVIAQDVEKQFPTAVIEDSNTGYKKVDYAVLVAPIIQAFKELNKRITELFSASEGHSRDIASLKSSDEAKSRELAAKDKEINKLKAENAEMKARLDKIEKMLNSK